MKLKHAAQKERQNTKKLLKPLSTQQWMTLLSMAISLLVTGILLQRGNIYVYSYKITKSIGILFIVIAYIIIASFFLKMSKHGIYGLDWVARSVFILCFQTVQQSSMLCSQIINLLVYCGEIFCLTNGLILFIKSGFEKYKKAKKEQTEFVDNVEGLISIITALAAVLFSIIDLLIR